MKSIILILLSCFAISYANAQNIVNPSTCPMEVTPICYDPNLPCPACPCPTLPSPTIFAGLIFYYYPPAPAPLAPGGPTVTVNAGATVPMPPTSCPPGHRVAWQVCIDPSVACSSTPCVIIEDFTTPLTPPSCFTNHGPMPTDGCECNNNGDHICICFIGGDLVLGP
jgi:hypothetical protein